MEVWTINYVEGKLKIDKVGSNFANYGINFNPGISEEAYNCKLAEPVGHPHTKYSLYFGKESDKDTEQEDAVEETCVHHQIGEGVASIVSLLPLPAKSNSDSSSCPSRTEDKYILLKASLPLTVWEEGVLRYSDTSYLSHVVQFE